MARGIVEEPMMVSGELDYLDEGTLSHAFKARRSL
jgi:recombinational DNA repair protein RecR